MFRVMPRASSLKVAMALPSRPLIAEARDPVAGRVGVVAAKIEAKRSSVGFSAKPSRAPAAFALSSAPEASNLVASSVQRSRPAFGAGPIASMRSGEIFAGVVFLALGDDQFLVAERPNHGAHAATEFYAGAQAAATIGNLIPRSVFGVRPD